MFDPHLLRKAVPLTFLAFSACGVASQDATDAPTAPTGGSTVARLADGGATSCPNGGNVLKYGIDKNGNGKLDDSEVLGTFDICNGTSGTLTKLSNVAAGAQCSQGGVLVQSGPDTNNNGTLDDSEVASSTPICGAGGLITTVLGSITIENDDDLARYAATETVSGYLSFELTGMNGTVTLPNLRAVGMDLDVSSGGGGQGFLNAQRAKAAKRERKARTSHALKWIPTDTVTLSLPALQSIGGKLSINSDGVTVQAPALTTVGDELYCNDPNATFPALVSLGESDSDCGDANALFAQLTFYGSSYSPHGATVTNTKLTSVGVHTSYGRTQWDYTLRITDPNNTSVSMPALTQAAYLEIGGVLADNATLSLPALTTVGVLNLAADEPTLSFPTTPAFLPFSTITMAPLTVLGYAAENTQTSNGGYASVIGQFHHVGGAFSVGGAAGVTAVNANNLVSAGGIGFWNNPQATKLAMPLLTTLKPADPNYDHCPGNSLGNSNLPRCDSDDPNDLKAQASIVIQDNQTLTSVDFGSVSAIPGGLYFQTVPALTEVKGLSHLTSLGMPNAINAANTSFVSSLLIDHTGLTDLSAFASITSAPGVVGITYNADLADITALHLTGPADTCPLVVNNPKLPYCQAVDFITRYNTDCTVSGTAAQMHLKDPCETNTCSGATPNCVPDCNPGSTTGYTCQQ